LFEHTWKIHFVSEVIIEQMRQNLLKNPFFDISKAYQNLDADRKGFVVAKDVSLFHLC